MSEEEIIRKANIYKRMVESESSRNGFDEILIGLLDLYNKEKEKNKELEKINFKVNNNLLELAEKIENKIIELEEDLKENNYAEKTTISIKYAIKVLQELLEEGDK